MFKNINRVIDKILTPKQKKEYLVFLEIKKIYRALEIGDFRNRGNFAISGRKFRGPSTKLYLGSKIPFPVKNIYDTTDYSCQNYMENEFSQLSLRNTLSILSPEPTDKLHQSGKQTSP